MNYTKRQIKDTICKWSVYLLENKLASEDEVKDMLDEGLFKRAKTYVKNAFKHVGQGIAHGVKAAGLKIHDTFAANAGVKELMNALKQLWKKNKVKPDKIKFYIFDSKNTFPVEKFVLSKNKKALAALYSDQNKTPCTFKDLAKLLVDNKVVGNDRKITDFVEALVIGKIEDDVSFSESEVLNEADEFSRLDDVLDALKWSKKTALSQPKNIQKIMALLGIRNENALREKIKEHYAEKGDDSSISSDGSDDSDEKFDEDPDTADDKKPKKNKKELDKEKLAKSENDYLIKTTDDEEVGIKNNPFKNVQIKGNNIGIRFNLSKQDQKARDDLTSALG